jgi:uncharacterized protein
VPGMVTNITRFGAFVDIGVKQDGLVHVSEIANRFISDPNEVLKLNDKVQVKVTEVDLARKRIALSIKQALESLTPLARAPALKPGASVRSPAKAGKASAKKNKIPEPSMEDALLELKKKFKN